MVYHISKKDRSIIGSIHLDGSKSISNRALIIRALCEEDFQISHLSTSNDTRTLEKLLESEEKILDCGAAGTTFRFMTAYLALEDGTQILTGSERMKQRPIGVLVEALRQLGASIDYLEKEGYPPLKINTPTIRNDNRLSISASVSSQYLSALLMIGPILPNGLELHIEGKIVSRPYIEMTLNLMSYFGIEYEWTGNIIKISPQQYQGKSFKVEADWSAASYYYAMAAFSDQLNLRMNGLSENSVQGDAILPKMMEHFGITTTFDEDGILLKKSDERLPATFDWDFIKCPDIAQTLAVICAGLGINSYFTGLETLRIKETDRIAALRNELAKVQVTFDQIPDDNEENPTKEYFGSSGKAVVNAPIFKTYEDHRMAMAFAPLAMFGKISVEEPLVVGKSYRRFWEDLKSLDFEING